MSTMVLHVRKASRSAFALAVAALTQGCFKHTLTDFTPKRGMTCDEVRISGTIYQIGSLAGVWFNGVPASASIRQFPAPNGPREILAVVPPNAVTGPIRAKIDAGGGIVLGVEGTDQTFAENFVVTGSPSDPVISAFDATPLANGSSTLSWTVQLPVTSLSINGTSVIGTTSRVVTPTTTTTYTLMARNACLEHSQSVTVTIASPPPPLNLALALTPTSVMVERGKSVSVTAKIAASPNTVAISCATIAGVSCSTVNLPTGQTTTALVVTANGTAPFGSELLTISAKELIAGAVPQARKLTVKVVRATGNFAEVATSTAMKSSPDMRCTANEVPGTGTPRPFKALLQCGTSAHAIPYSVGGSIRVGGFGFSANSALFVVTSWNNPPAFGIAQDVSFITAEVPGVFSTLTTQRFEANEVTAAAASYVQPRFYLSPDASLAIVTGSNKLGPTRSHVNVYDLTTGASLFSQNFNVSLTGAMVVTQATNQAVSFSLDGSASVVVIP